MYASTRCVEGIETGINIDMARQFCIMFLVANIKSAAKRARQNLRRRKRNLLVKTTVRATIKEVRASLKAGDKEGARKALAQAVTLLDKAASRGVFHRNNASRKISRLSSQVLR